METTEKVQPARIFRLIFFHTFKSDFFLFLERIYELILAKNNYLANKIRFSVISAIKWNVKYLNVGSISYGESSFHWLFVEQVDQE